MPALPSFSNVATQSNTPLPAMPVASARGLHGLQLDDVSPSRARDRRPTARERVRRPSDLGSLAFAVLALAGSPAFAQAPASKAVPVTADNFIRAESDAVFTGLVAQGGVGKFYHNRTVQRGNRDTLYSTAVFDLDAGPVTITLPNAGKRFLTMIVIDEDHYAFTVVYGAGRHTLTRAQVGTRYALAAIRILADPNDPKDVARVNALQDAVKVEQPGGPGRFEVPHWDAASHQKVRAALLALGETLPDWRHAAGRRTEVDPVRHLIVTATAGASTPTRTQSIST